MGTSNGVSDIFGRIMFRKSGSSAHSTQLNQVNDKRETFNPPYMVEACGGDDENDALWMDMVDHKAAGIVVIGGLN